MKLFKNILASVKPHFLKGGKLEKMYPAYDAFETFLFVPAHTTHSGSHIRDAVDLKRTMITRLSTPWQGYFCHGHICNPRFCIFP